MRRTIVALSVVVSWGFAAIPSVDASPSIGDSEFGTLLRMIKPQPGESRYREIDWLTSVWSARRKAAAEGKPIFIWAGSGGGPVGVC